MAEHREAPARFRAGLWRLADPKISLASMASIFLGASAAAKDGPLDWRWLAATVAGIFFIEVAKNASGEIFDLQADLSVSDQDRSPFSGGKRVLVEGLLTGRQTAWIAALGYLLGAGAGLGIVFLREPAVFWLGLAGIALAYFYTAPPLRLSYRGLGETAVAFCYGPLIASGTYLVQRGRITPEVALLSLPLGLLIAAFLWINEFPDYLADSRAGKRNLVVRLGRSRASRAYVGILGAAALSLGLLPLAGLTKGVWLGEIFLLPAAASARIVLESPQATPRLVPAQGMALLAFLLMALGAGAGLLLVSR